MYGYKIFIDNEVVSCNRGYNTKAEANMYAESDVQYFNCKDAIVEIFSEDLNE